MNLFVCFGVALCLAVINSQEYDYDYGEEEEEGFPMNENLPTAVGIFAFLSYIAVDNLSRLFHLRRRKPIPEYYNCGRRNDKIEEIEIIAIKSNNTEVLDEIRTLDDNFCLSKCEFKDTSFSYNYSFNTAAYGNLTTVEVVIKPNRVPIDTSCLDNCFFGGPGSPFNEFRTFCYAQNNSQLDCIILDGAVAVENNQTSTNSINKMLFTPTTEEEVVISYCFAEIFGSTTLGGDIPPEVASAKFPLSTKSVFCSKLFQGEVQNLTLTGRPGPSREEDENEEKNRKPNFGLAFKNSRTPWLCSLRTRGFRGVHRCGVTLLSVYPEETVLVSAAHCNQICKETLYGLPLEMCCCRNVGDPGSCRNTSSYCGRNKGEDAKLRQAQIQDLQIVCGEFSLELTPEEKSKEEEIVLDIKEIINHPGYDEEKGPIEGFDICVYHVSNPKMLVSQLENRNIVPACFPDLDEKKYFQNEAGKGFFAGWVDPEPTFKTALEHLAKYIFDNMLTKETLMQKVPCADPGWMASATYYPHATTCFKDDDEESCLTFGNSGSPIVRRLENRPGEEFQRFAWVGTLSMSKGCDQSTVSTRESARYPGEQIEVFDQKAKNPGVFTDAVCYLDWVAEQYGYKAPAGWKKPKSCSIPIGGKNDRNKTECKSLSTTNKIVRHCKFAKYGDDGFECKLEEFEGYSYNVWQCIDTNNEPAICANNCRGVDPKAVIAGGIALVAATSASGAVFGPAVGAIGAGGIGVAGNMVMGMMNNRRCPRSQCRPRGSQTCCNRGRQGRCPRTCSRI